MKKKVKATEGTVAAKAMPGMSADPMMMLVYGQLQNSVEILAAQARAKRIEALASAVVNLEASDEPETKALMPPIRAELQALLRLPESATETLE